MELMSIGSILDFAIEHEQNAVAYYADMAGRMESDVLRGLFEALSGEERVHVEVLEDVREHGKPFRATLIQVQDAVADCPPEAEPAIEAALRLAMTREKAAFRLYYGLAQEASDAATRSIFLDLARQEACHRLQLELVIDTWNPHLAELNEH
jgi:rubrerythrin